MGLTFGVQIPYLSEDVDRDSVIEWVRLADAGPFHTLTAGDRMTFRNLDQFSVLAAAAVLTERVRLMTSITILPAHPAALVAKRAATVDVLSDGRFVLGVGVGGRPHDYQAAERPMERRHQILDEQVAQMRRIWSGAPPFEGAEPIGPPPIQAGGPPLFCSALGPKAIARGGPVGRRLLRRCDRPDAGTHGHAAPPSLGSGRSRHGPVSVHDDLRLTR